MCAELVGVLEEEEEKSFAIHVQWAVLKLYV